MHYRVIHSHRSEFPQPITFARGAPLAVGERYTGAEAWDDWYFCTTPGQAGGWVPSQVFRLTGDGVGEALEDYTARELDVDIGERLLGTRQFGGWVWCSRVEGEESGWVPLECLRADA
ncbi:SH3 domain-containing protein [Pseudomonas sp. ZM23]|uniref:SH3 domain-containing protein n=1 Tax=Pseudomonas triclosanedens TaxID=2961893 RepID=A0ABY6ZQQ4_9PSED|nr:SH3 domain-containing protein [Pseudomonas triclosanedens]MCP8466130.1 SH3 domain-containing protein [Pseudomonas triclosanedens]MCP8472365.1 SH3 domain-containing protein [Pseudomonas triclosanedens]MCP8477429.1 SH3 domain-containing protein [Pseudomonas triclosanedens]WAI47237.1 SH3 domain-containing protein [Pseudomonas triclosanedens]